MTIVVAVKVNDGLVLAADSAITIQGGIAGQPPGILKTYSYGRKLSHVKDYPIGTLTWGVSILGSRTIESLINEYEFGLPRAEDEGARGFQVRTIADGLRDFLLERYEAQYGLTEIAERPRLGVLVSGYSDRAYFPEQYLIEFPQPAELQEQRPNKANGEPDLGVDWFGMTDAISRLIKGIDSQQMATLLGTLQIPDDQNDTIQNFLNQLIGLINQLEYPIAFEGMPLQDAIDFAIYLVEVTIGRYRFGVGAPLCGGEVDVAVITPQGFNWVYRKDWHVTRDGGHR